MTICEDIMLDFRESFESKDSSDACKTSMSESVTWPVIGHLIHLVIGRRNEMVNQRDLFKGKCYFAKIYKIGFCPTVVETIS